MELQQDPYIYWAGAGENPLDNEAHWIQLPFTAITKWIFSYHVSLSVGSRLLNIIMIRKLVLMKLADITIIDIKQSELFPQVDYSRKIDI